MLDVTAEHRKTETPLRRRERQWWERMLERGRQEMFSEVVTITPGIAEIILERNVGNRGKKIRKIREMVEDISAHRWSLNGETIIISMDGYLNDGQNRLYAVVEAGEPIETLVVFGVPRESQLTIDTGTSRSVGDMIKMKGGLNYNAAAATARLLLGYQEGVFSTHQGSIFSKVAIHEHYMDNKEEIDEAVSLNGSIFARKVSQAAFAAAYIILTRVCGNGPRVMEFLGKVAENSELSKNDARFVAHNYLATNVLRPNDKLALLLYHWNAWREGRLVRSAITASGQWPKQIKK